MSTFLPSYTSSCSLMRRNKVLAGYARLAYPAIGHENAPVSVKVGKVADLGHPVAVCFGGVPHVSAELHQQRRGRLRPAVDEGLQSSIPCQSLCVGPVPSIVQAKKLVTHMQQCGTSEPLFPLDKMHQDMPFPTSQAERLLGQYHLSNTRYCCPEHLTRPLRAGSVTFPCRVSAAAACCRGRSWR